MDETTNLINNEHKKEQTVIEVNYHDTGTDSRV